GKDPPGVVKMLLDHPDLLGPALARIARDLASFSTASVEAGGAGVFFAISGYASADLMSEEDYRRLALGHDLSVIELLPASAWFNVAHLCGPRLLFGLEVISPPDFPTLFLSAGIGPGGVPEMIVLMPHPEPGGTFPAPKPERVLHHMAFAVEPSAYDDLEARCRAAGLEVRQGIHPVLKGVRTFYVDDPEGNEVEIIALEA